MAQKFNPSNKLQDFKGFFVEPGMCLTHGCCIDLAPTLFTWSDDADEYPSSTIISQPDSDTEMDQMLEAISVCPMDCIRYGGTSPKTIKLLKEIDVYDVQILHPEPQKTNIITKLKSVFKRK